MHLCTRRVFMTDGSVCCAAASLWLEPQQLCLITYAAQQLFCHVKCSQCLERETSHNSNQELSSELICDETHTHTLCCHEMFVCVCVHMHSLSEGVSRFPREAATSGFIACIDCDSSQVKGSICGLQRGVDSSVLPQTPPPHPNLISDTPHSWTQHLITAA